ncbi:TetR/AcrR family transcriptional regulator [Camelliibacillus cellulosilyticus]|uniref:TetR/AcrR family transcriptional regulator n=1 Tax=Camelliibacillus cellulosilyticus TaxID=2174486 RepID=A0ABV9GNN9_9BACL
MSKKTAILKSAMTLFSQKGFHTTSIQEIADASNVSKGTIYTYFSSKEDLLSSIFKHYIDNLDASIHEVLSAELQPKEKFLRLIEVSLREQLEFKGFFDMTHRDQTVRVIKDIKDLIFSMHEKALAAVKNILREMYGEKALPYLPDVFIYLQGMSAAYIHLLIAKDGIIDIDRLATFLYKRMDQMIGAMIAENEKPMLTENFLEQIRRGMLAKGGTGLSGVLKTMKDVLDSLNLEEKKQKELRRSIEFLAAEIPKDEPQTFLIKGVLSNFHGIPELEGFCKQIERDLDL